ncbi:hypothetical protein C2G38_2211662 [Gigaspora rosea]|uniref:DNA polymerase delta catalytic subunit n=1 Tax=Gigaspora rosea TaxID=44941 RepID=A0A397UI28_9GLOM|nr:hypothetical protein C2G38_2211662 [Gigaspora rosea]
MSTQTEYNTPIVPTPSNVPAVDNQNFQESLSSNYISGFEFKEREGGISENGKSGQLLHYSGEKYLPEIPFMAIDNEGSTENINGIYCYVLRLYGQLIDGQKALVNLIVEHIKAFPFRGYNTEKKPYLQIYTNSTGSRKKAIKAIQDNNYETASDDIYLFYRKVARENGIQLTGWSILRKYIYKKGKQTSPLCSHEFHVSIKEFRPLEDLMTISDRFPISALLRDRTLILTWDIETQSRELGEFAEVLDQESKVFIICITLHWKDDLKPLKQICLVDVETAPDPNWITIICGNQVNLLKAFALCWQAFAPDIHIDFNDSDYDWPFIIERAYHLDILEWIWERMTGESKTKEEILKWKYRGKIEAKSENNFNKKSEKYTTEEGEEDPEEKEFMMGPIKIKISAEEDFTSSFLKLPGCVPIDVRVCLKKHYPRAEVDKKSSLAFYLKLCGLDAKANMLYDKIEVASIAYVSLFDSHYCANGMKVRNLLGAYAFKREMVISTRIPENTEKGKYPGAYVFPPKKGIETRRPVMGLDFASLYPSLIMAYNLSPNKIILTHIEADIAQNNGKNLHKIEFTFNNRTVRAWSIKHNNQLKKKGLYSVILEDLFNKRLNLKARLAPLGKKKQHLEKMINSFKKKDKKIPESLNSEYSSICFDYDYFDSKQRALKVYMNTFYGEAGNSKSPIFLRELAGGTTSAGKYNPNLIAEFVTKKGFGINYGNTDSLYLTCPDGYYEKCNEAFSRKELSKEVYWTEMVKITMNVIKKLRYQINAYLRIKSETSYLKMVYEEVLFPVCFTGKKKYFGIGHEDVVNFKPKNLFMKGIDTVKQGNSELFRFIGKTIMWEAMDIDNTRSIHKIVEDTLKEARNKKWNFNEFIRNERVPDPGERFSYVVVKGPRLRDEKGRLTSYRVGTMVGMCARFINEDIRYQPPPSDKIMQLKDSDEKEKQIDAYSQKEAKKWLTKYIKALN